jgi:SAM-dependent methyltransferase
MNRPTERFTSRADAYARYRPGYPAAAVTLLQQQCGLTAQSVVADVGSGTGILTALLLQTGAEVFGVEPNSAMRAMAETQLREWPRFHSVAGAAEDTRLAMESVDLYVAGQAFHWFDVPQARREALRVIRPGGFGALLWNERPNDASAFLADYEAMLRRHAPQYATITASRANETTMRGFFGGAMQCATFPNQQDLDFEGLRGRLMSSSYAPEPADPGHAAIMAALRQVFDAHAREGRVVLPYQTLVYFGCLKPYQTGTRSAGAR